MRYAYFKRIRRDMPRTEGKSANTKYTLTGMKSSTEVERGHPAEPSCDTLKTEKKYIFSRTQRKIRILGQKP